MLRSEQQFCVFIASFASPVCTFLLSYCLSGACFLISMAFWCAKLSKCCRRGPSRPLKWPGGNLMSWSSYVAFVQYVLPACSLPYLALMILSTVCLSARLGVWAPRLSFLWQRQLLVGISRASKSGLGLWCCSSPKHKSQAIWCDSVSEAFSCRPGQSLRWSTNHFPFNLAVVICRASIWRRSSSL